MGFFADAGPLQLFVSNHLIPDDFDFVSADEPAFVSADEAVRVQAGAEVRMRIVGTRMDATEIVRPRACARDTSCMFCFQRAAACLLSLSQHGCSRLLVSIAPLNSPCSACDQLCYARHDAPYQAHSGYQALVVCQQRC